MRIFHRSAASTRHCLQRVYLCFYLRLIIIEDFTIAVSDATESLFESSTTPSSSRRVVSNASIANPGQDSTGGDRIWATNEKASDAFANILMLYIRGKLFPKGIKLDWVKGRSGDTTLTWSTGYFPLFIPLFLKD